MSRLRVNRGKRLIDAPNVTPLLDLTFLLLIVFMMTAPALEHSLDISPPELNAEPIMPIDHRIINLDKDGQIHYENDKYTLNSLTHQLQLIYQDQPNIQIFIRGDRVRPYGEIIDIMKVVKQVGFTDVSLVTVAEGENTVN